MTFPPMELGSNYLRRNVPFQVNNDKIGNMLKSYGEVYKCQNYYKKTCKYINFNSSGDMIAWVKLKKIIHLTKVNPDLNTNEIDIYNDIDTHIITSQSTKDMSAMIVILSVHT